MYRSHLKIVLDKLLSLILLLAASPLMLVIIVLMLMRNEGKVFFVQTRLGLHGSPFKLIKFSSMVNDVQGHLIVTKLGRVLRNTSLDELPQLINVLKGEMSLIGPRPLLLEYENRYSHEQRRRHEVLPGITGWAQVNGRISIPWAEKFKLDLYYVDHLSFALDMSILIKTICLLLSPKHESSITTEKEFQGN